MSDAQLFVSEAIKALEARDQQESLIRDAVSTHGVEAVTQMIRERYGEQAVDELLPQMMRTRARPPIIDFLKSADAHILLPLNGAVYRPLSSLADVGSGVDGAEIESFVLPYPLCTFSFPADWNFFDVRERNHSVTSLGPQWKNVLLAARFNFDPSNLTTVDVDPDGTHVMLMLAQHNEAMSSWSASPVSVSFPYPVSALRADNMPIETKVWLDNTFGDGTAAADEDSLKDTAAVYGLMFHALLQAFHSLRAGATLAEKKISPLKRDLMRKRGLEGFDYHILELPAHVRGSVDWKGGTHAAPRLHKRRAHVRELKAAIYKVRRFVFVRATMVGSRAAGSVDKSYSIAGATLTTVDSTPPSAAANQPTVTAERSAA